MRRLCQILNKSQHYFDKLTFIIQTSQMSEKKADDTGVISAEEERGAPGYPPERFAKFGPWATAKLFHLPP